MFRVISTNGLSDRIEQFILNELQQQSERMVVLRRKDVAEKLECAPSQVTYVVNTRFTPREGFYVESRRGANGFIRIAILEEKQQPEEETPSAAESTNRAAVSPAKSTAVGPTDTDSRVEGFCRELLSSGMVTMRECLLLGNVMQIMLTTVPRERREQVVKAAFIRTLQIIKEGK